MPEIIEIEDYSAPQLDVFARLTEAQLRNKLEPEKGIFIAESPKVIRLALNAGYEPVSMLTERRHIIGDARDVIEMCGDIPVYTAQSEVLEKLAGYKLTRGVLCAMRRKPLPKVSELLENAHRIVVLENIMDSTNIGAVFRSAAALGIDAVLVTPCCCDPLCRRAVRVSMGTILQVPWTRIGEEPADWPDKGLALLRESGFKTAAMTLNDRSVSLDEPALAAEEKLALVLGTEGDGLSAQTTAGCDYSVKIPMFHDVDSLNVAAAGAVAFWELRYRAP